MILTDASVVIIYERVPTPRLKKIIIDEDAAVCGVTIAELFAGVRSAKDEAKLRTALADFKHQPMPDSLWETIGRNQAVHSAKGVTVPLCGWSSALNKKTSSTEPNSFAGLWPCHVAT
jgi:predicted nucleic acid-binding protein